MKIRFIGPQDERVLTDDDMTKLGFEDHTGLWWSALTKVVEVEDEVGEMLTTQLGREFILEPEPLMDLTKEELVAIAKEAQVKGAASMNKEDLVAAIETARLAPDMTIINESQGSPSQPA